MIKIKNSIYHIEKQFMIENQTKDVKETWDAIAESFDQTRKKPWKQCLDFIDELSPSSVVADLGCGNGRHLIPCAEQCKKVIGLDISRKLLRIAHNKTDEKHLSNVDFIHGTLMEIPLKDNTFDAVLYIAALHNIRGREERLRSLREVKRVLKNDGRALISVWSRWQDKYRRQFFKHFFAKKTQEEFGDIDIYWKQHHLNVPRFYHLYSKREFINDIKQSGLTIERIHSVKLHAKKFPDNYFIVARKKYR